MNQTDISVFNPANAFDAEGLTQLTQHIEERRRLRNQIENDARIEIKLKDYQTEQRSIEIDRDLEYARFDQAREIEARRAAQQAAIEEERSSSAISITTAKVRAEQEAERIRIAKDKLVDAERINSKIEIRLLDIDRNKDNELRAIETGMALESQRIISRQQVESERIQNERKVKEFEIQSRQDVQMSETAAAAEVDKSRLEAERAVESSRIEIARAIETLAVEKDKQIRIISELSAAEREKAAILKRYNVDLERLKKDEEITQLEIAKNQKIKLAETSSLRKIEDAAISVNRELDELRIAARKYVERFEIERSKEIEIADKERLIAVINKSIEEAYAKTEAAEAQKALAAIEEQVVTAREEEAANRAKRVELIDATSKAERDALRLVSQATADREATEQRALAEIAEANASAVRYEKGAVGQTQLNAAENMRSDSARRSAIYENLVRNLPTIIRETVSVSPAGLFSGLAQRLAEIDEIAAVALVLMLAASLLIGITFFAASGASIVTIELIDRFVLPGLGGRGQRLAARIALAAILAVALAGAVFTPGVFAVLSTLSFSLAAQAFMALLGLCWMPWLSRRAVITGLILGLIIVVFTEPPGLILFNALFVEPPWGRWPLTIHSAAWGLSFNMAICLLATIFTRDRAEREQRSRVHARLRAQDRSIVSHSDCIT